MLCQDILIKRSKEDNSIQIDDKTIKSVFSCILRPVVAFKEIPQAVSIYVIKATDCPSQPHAQIEQQEIKRFKEKMSYLENGPVLP